MKVWLLCQTQSQGGNSTALELLPPKYTKNLQANRIVHFDNGDAKEPQRYRVSTIILPTNALPECRAGQTWMPVL